jgi:RimJ/RimL family protein N-acetyltransferase
MHCPRIETERLILRALTLDDFDRYAAIWQNEALVRYISGKPVPREASWSRLIRTEGHWQLLGFGFWAVEEKASGLLIGEAGFQDMHRAFEPSIEGSLETGWGLLPEYHGKGYASEALSAAMAWAAKAHPHLSYSCIINPANVPSLRLADKLGFKVVAQTDYNGPILVLRKPAAV